MPGNGVPSRSGLNTIQSLMENGMAIIAAWHGMTLDEHVKLRDSAAKDGFRFLSLSIHGTSAAPHYTAVMIKRPVVVAQRDWPPLTNAEFQKVFNEVPTFQFLMVDGEGDPNTSQEYAQAVEALFSVSYITKFMVKKGPEKLDYAVMPLEGLWWADDMSCFVEDNKAKWKWTMMIAQPSFVACDVIETAMAEVRRKKKLPAVARLRLENFSEGRCAQVLHVGPFSDEGPTIERLHQFIDSRTSRIGKHHEIYLSDIRRADPKKWKTIIRHPML